MNELQNYEASEFIIKYKSNYKIFSLYAFPFGIILLILSNSFFIGDSAMSSIVLISFIAGLIFLIIGGVIH
jgi:hypothetical protein